MKSFLLSLSLAVLALTSISPSTAQFTPKRPGIIGPVQDVANSQRLIYNDGRNHGFLAPATDPSLFALDLTTPWPTSSPAWSRAAFPKEASAAGSMTGTMAMTKDGSDLLAFGPETIVPFNIQKAEWGAGFAAQPHKFVNGGATTDTDTGLIYGMEQTVDPSSNTTSRSLHVFDPKSRTMTMVTSVPTLAIHWLSNGVYSKARKSLFYPTFGDPSSNLQEFNLATKTWTAVMGTGDVPSARYGSCFIADPSGKKLIVVGGGRLETPLSVYQSVTPKAENVLSDIYMFDVESAVWTKVTSTPRAAMVPLCAVSGDSLIVVGGFTNLTNTDIYIKASLAPADDIPMVYDMKNNEWLSNYTPSQGSGSGSGSGSESRALSTRDSGLSTVGALLAVMVGFVTM
ncbi:hypothetical protein BGZ82_002117 [Podila clonocystis]|nr:hypothetical protein BGZ82_002117 [Podila clonocystis]